MSKRLLPSWRLDPIDSALRDIKELPTLHCVAPEAGDSEEVLRVKKNIADMLKNNCGIIADRLELALSPKARRSASGYPYIPTWEE